MKLDMDMENIAGSTDQKYQQIYVQLSGEDGNTGAIMARVARALKDEGVTVVEVNNFRREIFNADNYDHVLRIVQNWVSVG